ncbi:Ig-like domain-containing protein [Myxococcus sp. K15C18031901]|nr:Ig-like domain-containing protein [Myxococcus dinghuensis]
MRITAPAGTAHTNGVLEVRLELTGDPPERVELLRDGEPFATVESPYAFRWDTRELPEGTYRLTARAVFGETPFTSEERQVVVDRTAPQVVSRSPTAGATEVWVKSPIQAVFSEPLLASTVTDDSVRLTVGDVEVARTVSLSADGRTVTVSPNAPPTAPAPGSLTLAATLTDLAGNTLVDATAPWSWTYAAVKLVPVGEPLARPAGTDAAFTMAFTTDKRGRGIIARVDRTGYEHSLRIIQQDDTGSWSQLGSDMASRGSDYEPYSINLKTDPVTDLPIVAWHEGNGSNESELIYVARWNGSSWQPLGNPGITSASVFSRDPVMEIDAAGRPLVAVSNDNEQTTEVHQWSGTAWKLLGDAIGPDHGFTRTTPLSLILKQSQHPLIALAGTSPDNSGLYVFEWTGTAWRLLDGQTLAQVKLPGSATRASNIVFALDDQQRPTLAWLGSAGGLGGYQVFSYSWDGKNWTERCTALPLLGISSQPDSYFGFSKGSLWFAWSHPGASSFRIEHCSRSTWSFFAGDNDLVSPRAPVKTLTAFSASESHLFHAVGLMDGGDSVLIRPSVNQ